MLVFSPGLVNEHEDVFLIETTRHFCKMILQIIKIIVNTPQQSQIHKEAAGSSIIQGVVLGDGNFLKSSLAQWQLYQSGDSNQNSGLLKAI